MKIHSFASMFKILLIAHLLAFSSFINPEEYSNSGSRDIQMLYQECGLQTVITYNIFKIAMTGLEQIDNLHNRKIITIIDFSKPSTKERLFVIDLENKHVIYKSLVAHGKNSGGNMASSFSNAPRSLKSCLGFFITAETYAGKYGYSLKLDGLEPGINDNARQRGIVVHGADFVSFAVAHDCGLLGRSYGCPALPLNKTKEIIDKISNGSCLFIYGIDPNYLKNSKVLNNIRISDRDSVN